MPEVNAKTDIVTMRLTPARKATYRTIAALDGLRLSEWLRTLAERRIAELETRYSGGPLR